MLSEGKSVQADIESQPWNMVWKIVGTFSFNGVDRVGTMICSVSLNSHFDVLDIMGSLSHVEMEFWFMLMDYSG